MTIGIAASGPRAGLAIFRALAAVERVASGAIGGYAVFAAFDRAGVLYRAETQRGGSTTLFVDGESTGMEPPVAVAQACIAGLMSSGPDRPEPLSQFVPAESGIGIVTGHRLPNAMGATGQPVNLEVLDRLRRGLPASEAVDTVLDDDPEADAGIIAVDCSGRIHARNSARVSRRPDLGEAHRHDPASGARVAVLQNCIHPAGSLAALAADIAPAVMAPANAPDDYLTVHAGTPLRLGDRPRLHVDADGALHAVEPADARLLQGRHNCAAIYPAAMIARGGTVLGEALSEPNVVVDHGRIESLSGQDTIRIGYRRSQRCGERP